MHRPSMDPIKGLVRNALDLTWLIMHQYFVMAVLLFILRPCIPLEGSIPGRTDTVGEKTMVFLSLLRIGWLNTPSKWPKNSNGLFSLGVIPSDHHLRDLGMILLFARPCQDTIPRHRLRVRSNGFRGWVTGRPGNNGQRGESSPRQ